MSKKNPRKDMNYLDHLEILRWKILSILFLFLISFILIFTFIKKIIYLLQEPIKVYNINLYYFKPYEKFATYIKIAFYLAFVLVIPFIIIQIISFTYPALKKEEKKYFTLSSISIPIIFISGAYFSYKYVSPLAFGFFLNFSSGDMVKAMWSFGEYYSLLLGMMLASGLVFQLPLLLLFFIKIGFLKLEQIKNLRPYIILIIALISAFLSPPDIISQILIGVPLYLLFELAVIIGFFITKKTKQSIENVYNLDEKS